jgi:hypothetical protein
MNSPYPTGLSRKAAKDLYGRNLHIAENLTALDEVGRSLNDQQCRIDANFERAVSTLEADQSKVITEDLRRHLLKRLEYGRGLPDVHYDTVLFEVLVHMALRKAQETPTFRYLEKLSTEAAARRTERPPRDTVLVPVG